MERQPLRVCNPSDRTKHINVGSLKAITLSLWASPNQQKGNSFYDVELERRCGEKAGD